MGELSDDFNQCKERSLAAVLELRADGHDARWIQVAGLRSDAPDADPRWKTVAAPNRIHYIVSVNGTYLDYAPHQFWPDSPSPLNDPNYLDRWANHWDITGALD